MRTTAISVALSSINQVTSLSSLFLHLAHIHRVFHDPLVSLNFEGFDPQIFLNDPQNLQFTFFISYEGGHCDPLNRKLRENPVYICDMRSKDKKKVNAALPITFLLNDPTLGQIM